MSDEAALHHDVQKLHQQQTVFVVTAIGHCACLSDCSHSLMSMHFALTPQLHMVGHTAQLVQLHPICILMSLSLAADSEGLAQQHSAVLGRHLDFAAEMTATVQPVLMRSPLARGLLKELLRRAVRHEDRPSHPVVCCCVVFAGEVELGWPDWLPSWDCLVYVSQSDESGGYRIGVSV